MRMTHAILATAVAVVITGCAQTPSNPTVGIVPSQGKSFEAFQADQGYCRQYAQAQVAGQAEQANRTTMMGAGGGALGGAAIGAAGGAIGGNAGAGAAIGALSGLVLGTAGGALSSNQQQNAAQQQFNTAYAQCMYSRGNQVPGYQQAPPPGYQQAPPPRYQQAPAGYAPPPGYQQPPAGYQQQPGYQQPPPGYQQQQPGYQPPPQGY